MSLPAIRAALETALSAMIGIDVAWQNAPFTPTTGTPYAQVYLLPAQPDNIEIGPAYVEQGLMQVNLLYPLSTGPAAAEAKAEAIRAAFPFRTTLTAAGSTVLITATPEIAPARVEDDRWFLPVRIRWQSHVGG